MTKQDFITRFETIKDYHKQQQELGEALHKHLLNGYSVVCFGDNMMTQYVEMLAELSGIDKDSMECVIYEGGGTFYADGDIDKPFNVITGEDLWDFYKTFS